MNAQTTQTDGVLAWRFRNEEGGGVPILFIHGAGGQQAIWNLTARELASLLPDRPLVAIDLPGHGDAPPPGRDCIDEYAAIVRVFVRARGWTQLDVVGHSMGGAITQALAALKPEKVRRIALVATGAKIPVNPLIFELLPAQMDGMIMLYRQFAFGPEAPPALIDAVLAPLAQMDGVTFRNDFVACRDWALGERAAKIAAPALVVVGDKDSLTPPKRSVQLAESLPGARLETLSNTGHMVPVERPTELAALLAAHFGD
jgi:pimeloyl-ACP methyl ester carboxylesterase